MRKEITKSVLQDKPKKWGSRSVWGKKARLQLQSDVEEMVKSNHQQSMQSQRNAKNRSLC